MNGNFVKTLGQVKSCYFKVVLFQDWVFAMLFGRCFYLCFYYSAVNWKVIAEFCPGAFLMPAVCNAVLLMWCKSVTDT